MTFEALPKTLSAEGSGWEETRAEHLCSRVISTFILGVGGPQASRENDALPPGWRFQAPKHNSLKREEALL